MRELLCTSTAGVVIMLRMVLGRDTTVIWSLSQMMTLGVSCRQETRQRE